MHARHAANQLIWQISHYIQGFIHVGWLFRISEPPNSFHRKKYGPLETPNSPKGELLKHHIFQVIQSDLFILVGGHLTPYKGHLTIPKGSLWNTTSSPRCYQISFWCGNFQGEFPLFPTSERGILAREQTVKTVKRPFPRIRRSL